MIRYSCGRRNTGFIPATEPLVITGLNPKFVKVRRNWWEFWRTKS